jgi:Tol biopolymer transport system component
MSLKSICWIMSLVTVLVGIAILPTRSQAQESRPDDLPTVHEVDLPLKGERLLSETFTEGSWISLDVHPDGEKIVFDFLGDIYLLSIAGGRARALTRDMALNRQPRFSPDGERIVFVSDRSGGENLWTISTDGRDIRQITRGNHNTYMSPVWTPDGRYLVASRRTGLGVFMPQEKLWLFHAEGGTGAPLVDAPGDLRTLGAAFGSDERYVWFAQRTGPWQFNAPFPQYQLAVHHRESGARTTVTNRYGSAFRPTLSPDGRWLVYGSRHEADTGLRIRDLQTGAERWLAYPVQRDDKESIASMDVLPGMAFTPDSRALIASYGGRIWRIDVETSEQTEIPFEAEVQLSIGPEVRFEYPIDDAPTFTVREIRDGVPAPDHSKRIAFTALSRLYVAGLDGEDPRRLTSFDVGEHDPTWSPDGAYIAFATWDDEEGGHIWRVRADGRVVPERLTRTSALYEQLAWSPDGERIVAVRSPARALRESPAIYWGTEDRELVWLPAAGGEVRAIAPARNRSLPHFSSDPSRIYVFGRQDGLVSLRWDGSDERTHLKVTMPPLPGATAPMRANRLRISPDGRQAVARIQGHLYVVEVPVVGPIGPTISVADPASAAFPVRKLTEIGGQFPAWSADSRRVHWSLGNVHFVYDLDAGEDVREPSYRPDEHRLEVSAERDIPRGVAVLRGGRAITMRGDEIIHDADILIRDHRIAAIGRRGEIEIPDEAEVIDVRGKTVLPGFVDVHYHSYWITNLFRPELWQYHATLAYGVTTTRDPQTSHDPEAGDTHELTYADRVDAGLAVGPRVYMTGPGIFRFEAIRDLDHARSILRRYSDYWDTNTVKMYLAGNREQRQWVIRAARELELMPTVEGGMDLRLNLTHAIDGYPGLEHSLPIYPLYRDVVRLFTESQTVYTPTLLVSGGGPWATAHYFTAEDLVNDQKLRYFVPRQNLDPLVRRRGAEEGYGGAGWFLPEEHIFQRHAEFVRDLVAAGGRAAVGSHGELQGLGYHWELWSMQAGGLPEHDALRAATLYGAEAIGLANDLGSLEVGKLADLVVLAADPLENIRNTNTIRYVMKNGRLYDGPTLNEIWPRQRPLPRPYWYDDEPRTQAGIR